MKPTKYKTIKHYHEPGDLHEFTFSCHHGIKVLTNDPWRICLARSLDTAGAEFRFALVAFVFMPNHVHLLTLPHDEKPDIKGYLAAIKRPVAASIKSDLQITRSKLLARLTIRDQQGRKFFRLWQRGPGYDRNLNQQPAVMGSIDYLHMNPVRKKLATAIQMWRWSSAQFYVSDGRHNDPELPVITPLPADFWM